jgi:hypothetical protein
MSILMLKFDENKVKTCTIKVKKKDKATLLMHQKNSTLVHSLDE